MIKVISQNENETLKLAEKIGRLIFPSAVILLTGDLGAGKTVFVRGLAEGLGSKDLVKSPSYTIMNIYRGKIPLMHFDLYRLDGADEFYEIGGDEYLSADNVCAVEWHQNASDAFIGNNLEVIINDSGENLREISLIPSGQKYEDWLDSIKNDING